MYQPGYVLIIIFYVICSACSKTNQKKTNLDTVKIEKSISVNETDSYSPKKDSLEMFLSFFVQQGTPIPKGFCIDFLKVPYYDQVYKGCYAEVHNHFNDLDVFIIRLNCMAGGFCEFLQMYSFSSSDHKLISKINLYSNFSELDNEQSGNYRFVQDSIIEVQMNKKEYEINVESDDEEEQLVLDTTYYKYYHINKNGKIEKLHNFLSPERMFPITSYRILSGKELDELSSEELDIMRNEIFASHGYIFTKKKWQDYFGAMDWYVPKSSDVTKSLSIIEKVNINRILDVHSKHQ